MVRLIKEEMTMKKTSKILGTIGLSAALAFGCAMPAFATAPEFGEDLVGLDEAGNTEMGATVTENKGTTSSNVWVDTYVDNLSVTVPLNVKVVTKASGGALKATPSTGVKDYDGTDLTMSGYRIENYSGLNVKITNIAVDDTIAENLAGADKKWTLVPSTTNVAADGYSIQGVKGDLALTLAPSAAANSIPGNLVWGAGGAAAKDVAQLIKYNEGNQYTGASTPAVVDLYGTTATPYWEIAARQTDGTGTDHTGAIPGILGLEIAGSSSSINPNFKSGLTDDDGNVIVEKAFTITYTIAAA